MRQVNTQTSNPSKEKFVKDPNFHYVKVQCKDKGEWESPINDYLDGDESRGIPVYEEVSRDSKVTGSSRMAILKCPIEDYKKTREEAEQSSKRSIAQTSSKKDGSEFEGIQGGVISLD